MRLFHKTCLIALAAAALVAGCSQILGLKDPNLDFAGAGMDAAIDSAVIDGAVVDGAVIDGAVTDGPPIDGSTCDPVACKFGCEADGVTCRPAKLWVFPTTGQYAGNAFGGTATGTDPVRRTADAFCFSTVATTFPSRQCKKEQVHAVLQVSTSDSIGLMKALYTIPDAVPVHRADDDVLVANNWNDLIDTKPPREPVTSATGDQALIWTGAPPSTSSCQNWTSSAATSNGAQGDTSLLAPNWISRTSAECDFVARLLCVCWTVPE